MNRFAVVKNSERFKGNHEDYTENGKCSECGACCGDILHVAKEEIEVIKRYIKKHDIKAFDNKKHRTFEKIDIDGVCPFRDNSAGKCTIYPVRPSICKVFVCNYSIADAVKLANDGRKRGIISMRDIFYGDNQAIKYFAKNMLNLK